ncbi:MAG: hypothetical protein Q7K55_01905 [Candidatus Levybacteria bacterium]|nr:hypothetical protein [Candidatus Levybacteria bacterium]
MRAIEARLSGTVTGLVTRARELGSQFFREPVPSPEEIVRIQQLATGNITQQDIDVHRNGLIDQAITKLAYIPAPAGIGTDPSFSTSISPARVNWLNRRLAEIKAMSPEEINHSIISSTQDRLDAFRTRGIIS